MNPLKIGNVVRVENGRVEVVITISDLDLTHDGQRFRVGQLASYVTIPMDSRTLVGLVTSTGRQETLSIDVEPQIFMQIQLLGEIRDGKFTRGVNEYPIVGDDVWVAARDDFETIFGSFDQLLAGSKHPQSFALGKFAYNTDFEVKVDPDKFATLQDLFGDSADDTVTTHESFAFDSDFLADADQKARITKALLAEFAPDEVKAMIVATVNRTTKKGSIDRVLGLLGDDANADNVQLALEILTKAPSIK